MNIVKIIKEEVKLLNELTYSSEFNDVKNIYDTYFIIYKGTIFFLDMSSDKFVSKTKELYDFFLKENIIDDEVNFNDFDGAETFIESLKNAPKITLGLFQKNLFNKDIPKNAIIMEFFSNPYFEIKLSDILKKILNRFNTINWFRIEKKIYSRDELLSTSKKYVNTRTRLPEVVYHGTTSEFAPSILKQGIVPKSNNTIFKGINHSRYIFLTTSFETAKKYSELSVSRDFKLKNKSIVFEFNGNNLNVNKIVFDFDFYNRYIGKGNDSYDEINKENDSNVDTDKIFAFSNISEKNKGGLYKKFGYDGIVTPNKINKIWVETHYNEWEEFTIDEFKTYLNKNFNV